jgi:type VI secretion system protein ImpH
LRSFLGIGTPGLVNRQDVPDTSLIYYAGLLSLMPKSALGLQQFISDYFDVPILVEEFGGSWHALSEQDICQFADPPTEAEQLGFGVVVGDAVWDRASRARMRVGPLKIDRYLEFLPGGKGYRTIQALTRFYTNGEIIFEVQLILDRDSVPPCQLGADSGAPPQLGWLTWMNLSRPRLEDPGDTIYVLQ